MLSDIELVIGVTCREARVDDKDGLCITEVFPVIAVEAKCNGRPPENALSVKLDALMLVLVFRRKIGIQGKISATATGLVKAGEEILVDDLNLDLNIPEELDSTTQIINLQGVPVGCPSCEGLHEVELRFTIRDDTSEVAEIHTPIKIKVSHSVP